MVAFILHFTWFISYILINSIISLLLILVTGDRISFLKKNKNNYFLNLLFIFFFNKNLYLYKYLLSDSDIASIEIKRKKNWPNLHLIHTNINNSLNDSNKNTKISFKDSYLTFKFISNNLSIDSNFNSTLFNIYLILSKNYFTEIYNKYTLDSILYLLLNRYSLSSSKLNISLLDLNKFHDYSKYINLTVKNPNCSVVHCYPDTFISLSNSSKSNIKNYTKFKFLFLLENNFVYNLSNNKHLYLNVVFNNSILNNLKNLYKISFSASNVVKYISDLSVNSSVILYLRKNKVFNKSRYSRNRQTYRTGAYWCLYINIIAVVAFYFWFYKFTMNFGYLWWLLYSFILSIFFSRALKHRFYNPIILIAEISLGIKWVVQLILISLSYLNLNLLRVSNKLYLDIFLKFYQFSIINKFFHDKGLDLNFELLYVYQSFNWINKFNTYTIKIINNFIK